MAGTQFKNLWRWTVLAMTKRQPRRRMRPLGNCLESLESRALLSAFGSAAECAPVPGLSFTAAESGNHDAKKAPTTSFHIHEGTVNIQSRDLGSGTLTLHQTGLVVTGVFDTQLLQTGTFTASFKNTKAHAAKGATHLVFADSPGTEYHDKITVNFSKDGTYIKFKLMRA